MCANQQTRHPFSGKNTDNVTRAFIATRNNALIKGAHAAIRWDCWDSKGDRWTSGDGDGWNEIDGTRGAILTCRRSRFSATICRSPRSCMGSENKK
ncbi:hypothetical protein MTP99_003176 [Tenebrio molitor]|nr:hypothetical protein MTP99_003176 [Tenebrio molitor]